MFFASRIVLAPDNAASVVAAAEEVRAELGRPADIALVFSSFHLTSLADEFVPLVHKALEPGVMLGAGAQGVIADDKEIERAPAVSIWAGTIEGFSASAAHVEFVDTGNPESAAFAGSPEVVDDTAALVLLADPYSFPADTFVEHINQDYEGLACLGGLASSGDKPGTSRLFLDGKVFDSGAVIAAIGGPMHVETLVSQGCRPIGDPFIVTRAEGNIVHELGGRPAVDRIRELLDSLEDDERELAQQGLHVGRVIDESKTEFARGDFLIRSLVGIDRETGAIAVGGSVEVGATLQFHVRDAASADADLESLLARGETDPSAAMVFTCNGRGRHLFETPDHDAVAIRQRYPGLPLSGFFCAGEIGPVGGRNFLHGFTASVGFVVPDFPCEP